MWSLLLLSIVTSTHRSNPIAMDGQVFAVTVYCCNHESRKEVLRQYSGFACRGHRPLSHSVSRLGRPAHPKNSISLSTNISTSNGFYMPIEDGYVPIQRTTVGKQFGTPRTIVQIQSAKQFGDVGRTPIREFSKNT